MLRFPARFAETSSPRRAGFEIDETLGEAKTLVVVVVLADDEEVLLRVLDVSHRALGDEEPVLVVVVLLVVVVEVELHRGRFVLEVGGVPVDVVVGAGRLVLDGADEPPLTTGLELGAREHPSAGRGAPGRVHRAAAAAVPEDPTGQRETTRGTRARGRTESARERARGQRGAHARNAVRVVSSAVVGRCARDARSAGGIAPHVEHPTARCWTRGSSQSSTFFPLRMGLLAFDSLPIQMEAMLS